MSRIIPIPTTRVGDFFVRQRLVNQVQSDQLELFRLQNQVSTGRRIVLPSDDAPAALRAINLQRVIQRKTQIQTNLRGSRSVLGGADSSLADVSQILSDVRAAALGVADTVSSQQDRDGIVNQIDAALSRLISTANTNLNGRYLFAGARTDVLPFELNGQYIEYRGNEKNLQTYVDLGQLFETNVPGSDVFGGLSAEVRGTVDLDPQLTFDTLLSTLNGGEGLGPNAAISVSVNNGGPVTTSIVDLSGAQTIGDVARLMESNPPAGAAITVDIINNALTVTTSVGTVRIGEVAAGQTAKELGIFTPTSAAPTATVVGDDLNPAVLKTTPLENLLGTRAQGRLVSAGSNNDLILTAVANGSNLDGVTVDFVSDVAAGNELATYVSGTNTLTVHIQDGVSNANDVAAAINLEGTFTAEADYRDAATLTQAGTGSVNAVSFGAVTSGGSGEVLDTASGIVLNNGGESATLDISAAETVEDLLNLINSAGVGLLAEINASQSGIDVRSVLSGADFTIGENGGTTATQLGIRTYTGSTKLADFNRGLGVPTNDLDDNQLDPFVDNLLIVARDGTSLTVDLTGVATLEDVVDRINTNVNNNVGTTAVLARVNSTGNGIELVDSSTVTTGDLTIQNSQAAEYLGFLPTGQPQVTDNTPDVDGNFTLNSYRHSREDDLGIVARDGQKLWIDLTGATTVQDVIDAINSHPLNKTGTTAVTARLSTNGNGIELVDSSTGGGTLSVEAADLSQAAEFLGFIPNGAVTVNGSGDQVLSSEDRHTLEVDSIFNTLIRLRSALASGDVPEIGRTLDSIDQDLVRANFARAEIGSRLQSLDVIRTRLEDEHVQLQAALSDDIDVDVVEAISNLTARQYALQASLQTAANILKLSILDFI